MKVDVPQNVEFFRIATGHYYAVALGTDGNAYAWGDNLNGSLGDGTRDHSSVPVRVISPANVTFEAIAAGGYHTAAIGSNGKVYAWGSNVRGQLGNDSMRISTLPVAVESLGSGNYVEVSAGTHFTIVLGADGKAYGWGENNQGQLGNSDNQNTLEPVLVNAPEDVKFTHLVTSADHVIASGSDGINYVWGGNEFGQFGDGTTDWRSTPQPVSLFSAKKTVTGVEFDGIPGTNLTDNGDGTWSVDTSPHAPGTVDVVVSWDADGTPQSPITYIDGFTYEYVSVAPTVSDPGDVSVTTGEKAVFAVTASGVPVPTVTWEFSTDAGVSWVAIADHPGAVVSGDGLAVTVVSSDALDQSLYRATATNSAGAVVSEAATLTVVPVEGAGGLKPEEGKPDQAELAHTGTMLLGLWQPAILASLLVGASAVVLLRRRKQGGKRI